MQVRKLLVRSALAVLLLLGFVVTGSMPPSVQAATGGVGRTQAEAMELGNYSVESVAIASNGQLIRVTNGTGIGTARFTFTGAPGTYSLKVAFFDEGDGRATFKLFTGGVQRDSWIANNTLGASGPTNENLKVRTKANVILKNGDVILVEGDGEASEPARVDYIEIAASASKQEAENMTLSNYTAETFAVASNGRMVKVTNGVGTGTARYTFGGTSGAYHVNVGYADESDGNATYRLYVAGVLTDSWTANEATGSTGVDSASYRVRTKRNVAVGNGAEIRIESTANASEPARVDFVELDANPYPWFDEPLVNQTTRFTEHEKDKFRLAGNLLGIKKVALPEGQYLVGDNDHLGWPVAAIVGNTIVVVHYRERYHFGGSGPRDDSSSCGSVVLRSINRGQSWSAPFCLGGSPATPNVTRLAFGNAIGVKDGIVYIANRNGVFKSSDEGQTWSRTSAEALTISQVPGADVGNGETNIGPYLLNHPTRGLLVFGHGTDSGGQIESKVYIYNSLDNGVTWSQTTAATNASIKPTEPTGIIHNGEIVFVTRSQTGNGNPAQFRTTNGWLPLRNQVVTNITSSAAAPDTTDLIFNPVTQRYEALVTNRIGGGPGHEGDPELTVNLWSIDPAALASGNNQWRFEGTITKMNGVFAFGGSDGNHPGGTFIDTVNNKQYIYIYMGTPDGPAGIYQIERTLDTDALRNYLKGWE